MQFYSTKRQSALVDVDVAVFKGLPEDNGLFMPEYIPTLSPAFWDSCDTLSLSEIALAIATPFFESHIPNSDLRTIIEDAIDFEAPLNELTDQLYCLELFHGPSMAFKDFGARFMAGIMSYLLKQSNKKVHILVATSGDTGGAVAQGFYKKTNIDVHILYPSGKVSDIQEKQLTTLGENIFALEVNGTFDDCQKLVKTAFLDAELRADFDLASANSINISRLIPQAFYYAYSYAQLKKTGKKIIFSVPSGNFGNLSAGVLAYRMGMPVHQFIAATNINNVVPEYLRSRIYTPISPSKATISNAMDVGDPSNFPRLLELFGNDYDALSEKVKGYFYSDEETKQAIKDIYAKYNYVVCPHTAIAYLGLMQYLKEIGDDTCNGVFLSTAHYAKFLPDVEQVLGQKLAIPERLKDLLDLDKNAVTMDVDYQRFRQHLIATF